MGKITNFLRTSAAARMLLGFMVSAGLLVLAGWIVTGPGRAYAFAFDSSIRNGVRQMHSPMWTSLFLTVTKLGSTIYLTIIGSIAGLIFIGLRWFRPLGLFLIAIAGQAILHNGAKLLIERVRPSAMLNYAVVEGSSFPSGHAFSGLCLFASIAWLVTNRLENPAIKAAIWIATLLIVFLIGLSRIYIGVHYPTDVLAGWLAAAIWTAAVISTDRKVL